MLENPTTQLDLPPTADKSGAPINIGTRVRSFDFPFREESMVEGPNACWIEGTVEGVCRDFPDCPRYTIRVDRQVFAGKEETDLIGEHIFPPLNGTPRSFGGEVCDGVQVVT